MVATTITTTNLPIDDFGNPIPVLSYKPGSGKQTAISSAGTTRFSFAEATKIVTIYATTDCFIELGDETVVANNTTSHFIKSGMYKDIAVNDRVDTKFTNMAVLRVSTDGTLYSSERI